MARRWTKMSRALSWGLAGSVSRGMVGVGGPSVPGYVGLFDGITTYSLPCVQKRLYTSYTGPLIRVRRSSDDALLAIGYLANGRLDEAALLAHCGAGSGFIETVYDQSGNARDWVQATTANQPRIVNTGVIDRDEFGWPSPVFDGSNDHLSCPSASNFTNNQGACTLFGTYTCATSAATQALVLATVAAAGTSRISLARNTSSIPSLTTRTPDGGTSVATSGATSPNNVPVRLIGRATLGTEGALFRNGTKTAGGNVAAGPLWPASGSASVHWGRADTVYLNGNSPIVGMIQGAPDDATCLAIDAAMASLQELNGAFVAMMIAGQSNAEGRGASASSPAVTKGAAFFYPGFTKLADPVGGASTGSAWPACANELYALSGTKSIWRECATGGVSVLTNESPNWNVAGTLLPAAISDFNAMVAAMEAAPGITKPFKKYCWWAEGETAARLITDGNATIGQYQTALAATLAALKDGCGFDGVFITELGAMGDGTREAAYAAIRQAQHDLAAAVNYVFVTYTGCKDFPGLGMMNADNLHYLQTGYNAMGTGNAQGADPIISP